MEHELPQVVSEELQYYTLHNIWLMLYELWKRRYEEYEELPKVDNERMQEIKDTFSRLYNELKRRDEIEDKIEKRNKITTAFEWIKPLSTLPPATLVDVNYGLLTQT